MTITARRGRAGFGALAAMIGAAFIIAGVASPASASVDYDHTEGQPLGPAFSPLSGSQHEGILISVPGEVNTIHDLTITIIAYDAPGAPLPVSLYLWDPANRTTTGETVYSTTIAAQPQGKFVVTVPMGDTTVIPGRSYLLTWGAATPATEIGVLFPGSGNDVLFDSSGTWQAGPGVGAWYRATFLDRPTVTTVDPLEALPGQEVTITGTGFSGEGATVAFGGVSAAFTVRSDREITATVPSGLSGRQDISVTADGLPSSAAEFTVASPALVLSVTAVSPGDRLTVSGTFFPPEVPVDIVLHSDPVTLATVTTSPTGAFSQTVTIPTTTTAGAHTIEVGSGAANVTAGLTVSATAAASPAAALASTGTEASPAISAGAILLGLGGIVLVIGSIRLRRGSSTR